MKLSNFIRYQRNLNNMSQEKLAEIVEVSTVTISHIERGIKSPKYNTLLKIFDVFKFNIENYFLEFCRNDTDTKK